MTAPRPGSTIDRAVRALQSGPLPRAELARLIERDDDELDGLLRFGVRMGLLRREEEAEGPTYALGDGVPVEAEACPAPGPMLASAAPALAPGGDEPPAAPGRAAVPAPMTEAVPAAFPAAVRPPATAPAASRNFSSRSDRSAEIDGGSKDLRAAPAPSLAMATAEVAGLPPAVLAEPRHHTFRPKPGSQAEMLLAYLQRHAPHGGEVWLSPAELARSGAKQYAVQTSLLSAIRAGAVSVRGTPQRYQTGPNAPVVLGVLPVVAPARPAAPAPGPTLSSLRGMAKLPAGMTSESVVAASRAAWSDPPADALAPAAETAAFLLKQLDGEIDRLEYSLRIVRRRREEFAAAMKGARFAPPQFGAGGVGCRCARQRSGHE